MFLSKRKKEESRLGCPDPCDRWCVEAGVPMVEIKWSEQIERKSPCVAQFTALSIKECVCVSVTDQCAICFRCSWYGLFSFTSQCPLNFTPDVKTCQQAMLNLEYTIGSECTTCYEPMGYCLCGK